MKKTHSILVGLLVICFFSSCTPVLPVTPAAPLIVHYTSSTGPWLADFYACAGEQTLEIEQRSLDFLNLNDPDLILQLGEDSGDSPAYRIDTEEILVVVNPDNPVTALTSTEVIGLFTGSILNWQEVGGEDLPVQVWVFSSGEDIQQIFIQSALGGVPASSQARLASSPTAMLHAVAENPSAIGILTSRWLSNEIEEVYSAASVPVLVILPEDSPEAVTDLVACLQK